MESFVRFAGSAFLAGVYAMDHKPIESFGVHQFCRWQQAPVANFAQPTTSARAKIINTIVDRIL